MFTIYNTAHTRRAVFVYAQSHNALLSSEACATKASATLRNHQNQRKPKMPRMPNLLEQFVMPVPFAY